MNTTHDIIRFYEVNVPATKSAPAATVKVPFGRNQAHAIETGLSRYRDRHSLPSGYTVFATATVVPLKVGTTVPSASGTARFHGRTVNA